MRVVIALLFFVVSTAHAQVPKYGNDTLVDVACWNTEWLGDESNGPWDELLQYNNVRNIISRTDFDMWGLCEVSSNATWMSLLTELTDYNGAIATFSQTQKTALLWKKNMFQLISSQHVLTQSQYNYDFAGRPPLEVVLTYTQQTTVDTIYVYVVHLKAFADEDSYNRRKNAAGYLKTFLDANRRDKNVMVIGDWNDDVNASIWSGATESPFKNFVSDTSTYFYPSKMLSDQGKRSYASSNGRMIDHIMINKTQKRFHVDASARVLDSLPFYVSGYVNNTSDHYPVMSRFNFKRYNPVTTVLAYTQPVNNTITLYPNPATHTFQVVGLLDKISHISITDMQGKELVIVYGDVKNISVGELDAGCYIVRVCNQQNEVLTYKLIKQ